MVVYDPDRPDLLPQDQHTMLTAWFAANREYPHGQNILYQNFPEKFTYSKKGKRWDPRLRGEAIGRMFFASPNSGERFYLRILLTVIPGATSFEYLRTVDGTLCPTFYEACRKHGLLQDDGEWTLCLQEASITHTGTSLRSLFITMLTFCQVQDPEGLWDKFKDKLCDDLDRSLQRMGVHPREPNDHLDYGLFLIDQGLQKLGSGLN
jgi:hypothetical protein